MKRLDIVLVEKGLFISRSLAKDAIMEGRVSVNCKPIYKPSYLCDETVEIEIKEKKHEFASRGGNKLYDALQRFHIDISNQVVLDVGASTGGFTDVCLQGNAAHVYAVDSGSNQLIERLRNDPRVTCMEHTNARYLHKDMFEKEIHFVCMDVSFISIKLIIDAILSVVDKPFNFVFLIKPQFEAGKDKIGKNGIVKDKKVHIQVLLDMCMYFKSKGLGIEHICKSSTVGRDGNQEYLIHLSDTPNHKNFDLAKIVKE